MNTAAYQKRRKKRENEKTDWLRLFVQLAPSGYDAMKGYRDWQYSKIGDNSYNGYKGMYKFISDPTTAGISIANGISKVQKYQANNPGASFSQAFKDLSDNPSATIKTNSVAEPTKPKSINMDDVYDLLTPSEKREYDSLSSNLDNPNSSKALHLLINSKKSILESQGLTVEDAEDKNYIPRRKDLVDQTTLMGYNKDTNQNNLELDADGNPTGNTFEYSNETKNFSILTDPDGNPIDEVTTNLNDTTENQANIKALLGNENRDIVDTNLDNKSLAVPNKSFDVDKVEHFNPLKLSYEKYKKQLDNPDSFTPDDYHEMMFGRKPLKTTSDMPQNEVESLIFNSGLSDNDKLHNLVQYKAVMANKDKIRTSKQINVKTDNSIDIDKGNKKPAGFLKRLLGLDKKNKTESTKVDLENLPKSSKSVKTPVNLNDIFSSNIGKGIGHMGTANDINNLFTTPKTFDSPSDIVDRAGDVNTAGRLLESGNIVKKRLFDEGTKLAAGETAKEVTKDIIPFVDTASNVVDVANSDKNLLQRGGAGLDLAGDAGKAAAAAMATNPATLPAAPIVAAISLAADVVGKGINFVGGMTGDGPKTKQAPTYSQSQLNRIGVAENKKLMNAEELRKKLLGQRYSSRA